MGFFGDIGNFLGGMGVPFASQIGGFVDNAVGMGQKQQDRDTAYANLDYQKALNQQTMAREDNAVQRRVADLKAAGLSPSLAAGFAAGAATLRTGESPSGNGVMDSFMQSAQISQAQQSVKQSTAQTKLLESQAAIAEHDAAVVAKRPNSMSIDPWQIRMMDQVGGELDKMPKKGRNPFLEPEVRM